MSFQFRVLSRLSVPPGSTRPHPRADADAAFQQHEVSTRGLDRGRGGADHVAADADPAFAEQLDVHIGFGHVGGDGGETIQMQRIGE